MKNYTLLKKEYIDEISSEIYLYEHRCGAWLVYVENDDNNRVFSVAFSTPVDNNMGLAHITEHSVLCGSEKYPLKDPFNVLDKGSIHTYLNAVTYPDKTIYPIASTEEKDFETLLRVYVDAVHAPKMLEDEGIFRQEGHRSNGSEYGGIVLNEMKGVYSDNESFLGQSISAQVFEGTRYAYDSGGIPEDIVKSNYEDLKNFYREHYHPSNAVLYLYGKMDIEKYAALLDEIYLSHYEHKEHIKIASVKLKEKFEDIYIEKSGMGDTYASSMYPVCQSDDYLDVFANEVLLDTVVNIELSPMKKALIDSKKALVIGACLDNSIQTVNAVVGLNGVTASRKEIKETINSVWLDVYENGLDKKALEGVLNNAKYNCLEEDYGYKPKGLYYNIQLLSSLIYGKISFDALKTNELFEKIKNYDFKALVEKFYLNKGCYGFLKEVSDTEEEPKEIVSEKNDESYINYIAKEDPPEALASIEITKPSEISRQSNYIYFEQRDDIIFTPVAKKGIVYVDIAFPADGMTEKEISETRLLISAMDAYDDELAAKKEYYIGSWSVNLHVNKNEKGQTVKYIVFCVGILAEFIEEGIAVVTAMLKQKFAEDDKLSVFVNRQKILSAKRMLNYAAATYLTAQVAVSDYYYGKYLILSYPMCEHMNEDITHSVAMNGLLEKLTINGGFFYVTANEEYYGRIKKALSSFKVEFTKGEVKKYSLSPGILGDVAYCVPREVNLNAMSIPFDYDSGSLLVAQSAISNEYLWDEVRIKGGAYGAGAVFSRYGKELTLSSYRDPNIGQTYDVFKGAGDYLLKKDFTSDEISRFIIGAINGIDAPIKNYELNEIVRVRHIRNITKESMQQRRAQLLSTDINELHKIGALINDRVCEGKICTSGKKEGILESGIFEDIKEIDFPENTAD